MPACKPITLLMDGKTRTFESEKKARDEYPGLSDHQLQKLKREGGSFEGISVVPNEVRYFDDDIFLKACQKLTGTYI